MDKVVAALKKPKDALNELITLSKSELLKFTHAISSAKKDLQDENKQKEEKQQAKAKQAKAKNAATVPLHDSGASIAKAIPVCVAVNWKPDGSSWSTPVIITLPADDDLMKPDSKVRKGVDMFASKFDKSKKDKLSRVGDGKPWVADLRAQRPLEFEVQKIVNVYISKLIGAAQVDHTSMSPEIQALLQPSAYGVEKNYAVASSEREHLAAFRLGMTGTRSVVMTRTVGLSKFFRSKVSAAEVHPWKKVCAFFHQLKGEDLKDFAKDNELYFATVSKGDLLFVPAGFVVSELVNKDADFLGIRAGALFSEDAGWPALLDEIALITGKPAEFVMQVREAIAAELKKRESAPVDAEALQQDLEQALALGGDG